MKSRTIILVAALAIAAGAGAAYRFGGSPSSKTARAPAPAAAEPDHAPLLQARTAPSAAELSTEAPARPPAAAAAGEERGEGVQVARGATVATVNGVTLTGADLLAWRASTGEAVELTPEMHDFLLQRAIERELTFQAAKARNLELTAAQREQLAQVRANATERGEADPAQLDFEEKDASAQLLQQSLADADGAPSPFVDDAAVDRYLKEHAGELGPASRDPAVLQQRRIDVRQKLAAAQAEARDAKVRELLAALERAAKITR